MQNYEQRHDKKIKNNLEGKRPRLRTTEYKTEGKEEQRSKRKEGKEEQKSKRKEGKEEQKSKRKEERTEVETNSGKDEKRPSNRRMRRKEGREEEVGREQFRWEN